MLWRTLSAALEITKPEAPLDAVSFLRQLPVWGGCMKELSLLARECHATRRSAGPPNFLSIASPSPSILAEPAQVAISLLRPRHN